MSHVCASRRRGGFTLVEMLVVITIIGILVGLLIPTVQGVMWSAKNTAIATEINGLKGAVDAYKAKHNDHFPDFTNADALEAHIKVAYPRARSAQIRAWFTKTSAPAPMPLNLDPAEALVFWLSLIKANPRDPITGTGELEKHFDFDQTRLLDKDGDGWNEYYPPHGQDAPYVYFDGRVVGGVYAYATAVYPKPSTPTLPTDVGRVRPYRSNIKIDARDNGRTQPVDTTNNLNITQWMKPGQFQIISAGQDSHFGVDDLDASNTLLFKQFPTPAHYVNGAPRSNDDDNLSDFSTKTFGDSVP
jgi:prepilin-type N-terminal cleavage/methylation domain-containing protein